MNKYKKHIITFIALLSFHQVGACSPNLIGIPGLEYLFIIPAFCALTFILMLNFICIILAFQNKKHIAENYPSDHEKAELKILLISPWIMTFFFLFLLMKPSLNVIYAVLIVYGTLNTIFLVRLYFSGKRSIFISALAVLICCLILLSNKTVLDLNQYTIVQEHPFEHSSTIVPLSVTAFKNFPSEKFTFVELESGKIYATSNLDKYDKVKYYLPPGKKALVENDIFYTYETKKDVHIPTYKIIIKKVFPYIEYQPTPLNKVDSLIHYPLVQKKFNLVFKKKLFKLQLAYDNNKILASFIYHLLSKASTSEDCSNCKIAKALTSIANAD